MKQRAIRVFRQWWWLVVTSIFLTVALTIWLNLDQVPRFAAETRLLVGPPVDSPALDTETLVGARQLRQTYLELLETPTFLQRLIQEEGLDVNLELLESGLQVSAEPDSPVLVLRYVGLNRGEAVRITNQMAQAMERWAENQSGAADSQPLVDDIIRRIQNMENEVDEIKAEIASSALKLRLLQQIERRASSPLTAINQQRLLLETISGQYQRLYDAERSLAFLYGSLSRPPKALNQITILEASERAGLYLGDLPFKILLGAIIGFLLSLAVLHLIYRLSNTVESPEELAESTDAPVLGAIVKHQRLYELESDQLSVQSLPESIAAENYRELAAKLFFTAQDKPLQTVLIAGPETDEETGEVAANLAIVLTQMGNQVVLVDANLHNPTLAKVFGIQGNLNLVNILGERIDVRRLIPVPWAPGLAVLPGASFLANSFEILASPQMVDLMDRLKNQVDMVVINGPSICAHAESLVLASRVDGTLVVANRGKTRFATVQKAIDDLHSVRSNVLGSVLYNSNISSMMRRIYAPDRMLEARPTPGAPSGERQNLREFVLPPASNEPTS